VLTNSQAVPLSSLLLNPAHMSSTSTVPTLSEGWLLRHFVWKAANKQGPPRYADDSSAEDIARDDTIGAQPPDPGSKLLAGSVRSRAKFLKTRN
jgi:hypothetical protein